MVNPKKISQFSARCEFLALRFEQHSKIMRRAKTHIFEVKEVDKMAVMILGIEDKLNDMDNFIGGFVFSDKVKSNVKRAVGKKG